MNNLFLFIIIYPFILVQAGTVQLIIENPCEAKKTFKSNIIYNDNLELSAGIATFDPLSKSNVSYIGDESGMNSIYHSPIGKEAIYQDKKNTVYAFGWCYSVNNIAPDMMPNETKLDLTIPLNTILWWFGSAISKNGEWIEYCKALSTQPNKIRKEMCSRFK